MKAICGLVLATCLAVFALTLIGAVSSFMDGDSLRQSLPAALILIVFGSVGAVSFSYLRRSS